MRIFVRVCTRVHGKLHIEFTISSFCSFHSDQKCVLKVGGKLNNVVILVTRFSSKLDLAPSSSRPIVQKCVIITVGEIGKLRY